MHQIWLDEEAVQRKQRALAAFRSQLAQDATQPGPVLRASIVQRAARPFELFISADTRDNGRLSYGENPRQAM